MDDHDDLVERLRTLGMHPIDTARQSADLMAIAAEQPAPRVGSKVRVAAAFLAGLLIGSTGLAAADALPDPVQHAAHTALGRVGLDVPDPERYHGPECGAEAKRNHGAYVRDDHALAKTDCGKKVGSPGAGGADRGQGSKGEQQDMDPCHGKPPWAGAAMTPEEKAAAQADRVAQCGTDPDDTDELEGAETDSPDVADEDQEAPEPTSTTTDAPPSTVGPSTTVADTTTTTA